MSEIVHIPFQGDQLQAVAGEDGKPLIAFRPFVETFGLEYATQLRKLKTRSWATVCQEHMVAADGKQRQMAVVPVRTLTMWLATMNEHEVRADRREKLIAYQAEVADAIEAYWTDGLVINPRLSEEEARVKFDDLMGHYKATRMREVKATNRARAAERKQLRDQVQKERDRAAAVEARAERRLAEVERESEAKRADHAEALAQQLIDLLKTRETSVVNSESALAPVDKPKVPEVPVLDPLQAAFPGRWMTIPGYCNSYAQGDLPFRDALISMAKLHPKATAVQELVFSDRKAVDGNPLWPMEILTDSHRLIKEDRDSWGYEQG